MLQREIRLPQYIWGPLASLAIGLVADGLNHHPDIEIGYKRLTVRTFSHDAQSITNRDYELAEKINLLFPPEG
jgi:4a-hydroxytetrahydrobiopterin dehydratase